MDTNEVQRQHRWELRRLLAEYGVEHMLGEVTDCPLAISVHVARELIDWAIDAGAGPAGIAAVLREKPASAARAAQIVAAAEEAEPEVPAEPAEPAEASDDPEATAGKVAAPAQPDGTEQPEPGQHGGPAAASMAAAVRRAAEPQSPGPIGTAASADAPGSQAGHDFAAAAQANSVEQSWQHAFASVSPPRAASVPSDSGEKPQPRAQAAAADGGAAGVDAEDDGWTQAFARATG